MIYFLQLKGCSWQCPGCQSSHGCWTNIVTMLQIVTMLLWHSVTGSGCLHQTSVTFSVVTKLTRIPLYSSDTLACNNSHFLTFNYGLTKSSERLLSVLKQFVGIFTIFLSWVLELSLDLSKWEVGKHPLLFKLHPRASWDIHPLRSLFDSCCRGWVV